MSPDAPLSPLRYVESLSYEDKEAVLCALVEEAIAEGREPFAAPLAKEGGPILAYLLSAKEYNALQQQYRFPHADAEDYEAKRVPRSERDWATVDEAMEWIEEAAEKPMCELSPPAISAGAA